MSVPRILFAMVALATVLSACDDGGSAVPTESPTTTAGAPGLTRDEIIAAYEQACAESNVAFQELEQPKDDGGTFPPSPSKESLDEWAAYLSQHSQITFGLVSDLREIGPANEVDEAALDGLVTKRQVMFSVLEEAVEAADGGDRRGFSDAYTDWVAAGQAAGSAEEAFGIRCDA